MPKRQKNVPAPWQVPVAPEYVPEDGRYFDLAADAQTRTGVARIAGLRDLPRLQASFDVRRHGGGLHVAGRVSATTGQTCVVTLEPLTNEIGEERCRVHAANRAKRQAEKKPGASRKLRTRQNP